MDNSFHENRSVGLLLTFIGGMLDSYTYIRYQAFASAQTGNLILAIIQAYEREWNMVGKKLLSTLFFFIGILLAKFMIDYFKRKELHFWRLFLLYFEAVIFFVISLQFLQPHPAIITIMIAFTAAIQWISFDKINGLAYTNLFTTGNLKGVATNLYDYLSTKDHGAKTRFIHFLLVVVAFIAGAIVSVFAYRILKTKAILIIAGLFLYLALSETFLVWRFQRNTNILQKK
ncbi:YoaK family protein [Enterococcus dongliensis]|uniref:YoaK family protein n=1 Tax=Enterococcus dongliensis TaxID=2559925 RepID=A0AAP5NIC9_9ENTE|nr:YoaK family protein [Enterococcus dongliensis]MDT2595463.1 YoaK family protein [Enterococcus dongliensis]MDT2603323.1 YoaK family protein [Enterococcus dongliensis]MDT2612704.1 YoaK family protein [Enterococcus dongliensis]MDT2633684.1 YoaK family protein [Enterococcus dongliensis]MDT2635942.1 YoaK family protein [Enterococcus dongliensis]